MRPLIRLIGSLAALYIGLSVVSLGMDAQATGPELWSAGYYGVENIADFFILIGVLWLGGGIVVLFGLSGLLGAARGIGRPRGGRVLAIVSGIGVLLGMAVVVVAVNLRPDPGAEQYLTILLAVTAVILVALFGSAIRTPKPEAS